jgi:hypothetical protein
MSISVNMAGIPLGILTATMGVESVLRYYQSQHAMH